MIYSMTLIILFFGRANSHCAVTFTSFGVLLTWSLLHVPTRRLVSEGGNMGAWLRTQESKRTQLGFIEADTAAKRDISCKFLLPHHLSSTLYSLITLNNGDICNIVMLRFWTLNGFGHCFFFIINVDVRASLRAPWLILRVLKLTTM
jgi:hypothetical protein